MRLDLLWWRHLRAPREHVAENHNYAQVINMSDMILDMSTSPFFLGRRVVVRHPVAVGSYFTIDGKWEKAYQVDVLHQDDWLREPEYSVLVQKPFSFATEHGKVEWLEDELFPRLGTVSGSDNSVFRRGDKVMIVGHEPPDLTSPVD